MIVTYDYEGACATPDCTNRGIVFDVATVDGVMGQIVCGACGANFTDLCTPKAQ